MEDALIEVPEIYPPQPPGVVSMKIDPRTGELALPSQTNGLFEYFLEEHAPKSRRQTETVTPANEEEVKAIDLF